MVARIYQALRRCLVALVLLFCFQGVLQAAIITDLGTLGGADSYANGINNSGQIVGYSSTLGSVTHGFIWQNGSMTD
ncbi:MAG: hypothetical protein ACJ8C4_04700 [Gemmataceae bacterium]